jgi:hypothetical protein
MIEKIVTKLVVDLVVALVESVEFKVLAHHAFDSLATIFKALM